jgi:hypothetical protein
VAASARAFLAAQPDFSAMLGKLDTMEMELQAVSTSLAVAREDLHLEAVHSYIFSFSFVVFFFSVQSSNAIDSVEEERIATACFLQRPFILVRAATPTLLLNK